MRTVIGRYAKWFALFGLVLLTGCIGPDKALQNGYVDFDKAYADASNKQLLLNLARLANDDPVQFLQLGSFSAQYQYTYGGALNSSYGLALPEKYLAGQTSTMGSTPPTGGNTTTYSYNTVPNPFTVGGSLNGGVTETPVFQYLPLTGSNLVGAVLAPINDKVFLTFYDQGYPADLVARTMVSYVKHEIGFTTNSTTNYVVGIVSTNYDAAIFTNHIPVLFTNTNHILAAKLNEIYDAVIVTNYLSGLVPQTKTSVTTNYEYFVNSPRDGSYPDFLKFCNKLLNAQYYHILTVGPKSGDEKVLYHGTTTLTDVVAAVQANLSIKYDTNSGQITVTQPQQGLIFIENTNNANKGALWVTNKPSDYRRHYANYVFDNQPAGVAFTNANNLAVGFNDKYILVMRTVEAAMYTAAKEEARFRDLTNYTSLSTNQLKDITATKFTVKITTNVTSIRNTYDLFTNYVSSILEVNTNTGRYNTTNSIVNTVVATNYNTAIYYTINHLTTNFIQTDFISTNDVKSDYFAVNYIATNYSLVSYSTNYSYAYQCGTNSYGSTNIIYSSDENGPYAIVVRSNDVPFTVRPLMRLTCKSREAPPSDVLAQVSYGDDAKEVYYVGDPKGQVQSRTVFTMLSYLFAQAAISTQNLPVQQLIQVP